MKSLKYIIALLAIAALAEQVQASDGVRLGGNGLLVNMVPADPNGNSPHKVAAASCDVRLNRREVVLHWSTTPFAHVNHPELTSDSYLAATVTRTVGPLSVSPSRTIDHTDLAGGDESAAVAMGIQGNGKLSINLEVGIDNERAVAGRHCATVVLTVTGH